MQTVDTEVLGFSGSNTEVELQNENFAVFAN